MAIIKQCDKCKTIVDVDSMISITRKRRCRNQHDGEYTTMIQADYDLCEKCAKEIERMFISEEKMNEVILI